MILEFELPLLSRAEIFAKSFLLNRIEELLLLLRAEIFAQKTVLMSLELLNWPYYQELKVLRK